MHHRVEPNVTFRIVTDQRATEREWGAAMMSFSREHRR